MPQLCSDFGISGLTLPIISAQPGAAEDSVEKLHGAQVKLSLQHCGTYGEKSLYLTALNSNCRPTWAEHTGGDVTMRKMCVICSFSLVIYAQKNMLTWSLAFLSASKSFCNLSALSSAPSAWSCKDLIFRLTASSDVVPAIVYSHKLKKKKKKGLHYELPHSFREIDKERDDVLDWAESCVKTGWTVRKPCGDAVCCYLSRKYCWFQNVPKKLKVLRTVAQITTLCKFVTLAIN